MKVISVSTGRTMKRKTADAVTIGILVSEETSNLLGDMDAAMLAEQVKMFCDKHTAVIKVVELSETNRRLEIIFCTDDEKDALKNELAVS